MDATAVDDGWRRLADVPLLASLPPDRLRRLWEQSVPRRYAPGDVLRTAGQPAGHLLVLLEGRVAATGTTPGGQRVGFGQWDGPCALDKVALLDGGGHTVTLTARTPCAVRGLRRERFLQLVEDTASVRAHVLAMLAAQARRQQRRLAEAVTLPTEVRLAAWLLERAAATGCPRVPGTQEEIAEALGVTRVTVNRALARLQGEGLLRVHRGGVRILAPEPLALRAEALPGPDTARRPPPAAPATTPRRPARARSAPPSPGG
ncbi:Crp/Fnr family transcriptional regulator [Streptomyces capparidis]